MPAVYTRRFRVRFYECDAYRHLNNVNYLRYMQETAFDASADLGYDEEKYHKLGSIWFIRETEINYLRPIRSNDIVDVVTWVDDFRRVRSRRMYEFRLAKINEKAAVAVTDWVYLDRFTNRPKEIPGELVAAFMKREDDVKAKPRPRIKAIKDPPEVAFVSRRYVEWRDIDPAQHVNNAIYLAYFEECGIQAAKQFGWPIERMAERGFGILARKHHIMYRKPALLGDDLEISTWLSDFKRSTVTRNYAVKRICDNELLSQSRSVYVIIDLRTEKPIRFPADVRRDFQTNTI